MESRVRQDVVTGEVLEDQHSNRHPARAHVGGQRLDRVRDIETVVTLHSASQSDAEIEVVDLTVDSDSPEIELLRPGEKWADCNDSE